MNRTSFRSLSLALLLTGCGAEADHEADVEPAAGAETVVDPAGTTTELDPVYPEPIDELAETLSETHDRVDLGEPFAREAIGDVAGQRLIVDGAVVETWTFDTDAEARAFAARFSSDGRLFDGEPLSWTETTHVFAYGPMVLMYRGDEQRTLQSLDAVANRLTAHPDDEVVPAGPAEIEARVREAALARFALGGRTPLRLLAKERVVFADACLEVADAAETCDDVDTPGWRLTFAHGDDRFVAHTDVAAARVFWAQDG
jgi:hypothetical protein